MPSWRVSTTEQESMLVPRVAMFWTLSIYCSDRYPAWIEGVYGHKTGPDYRSQRLSRQSLPISPPVQ
ncbi:hypothetical protein BN2475_580010 [Paraburkholderia ribeironis]|uniref:Uncharacterized protein n=1 Tax=Paraburkholderia ribeironis TaxID=1247936 RepID=A0A1N7SE16_9BURK|nr:hypothetical protein BN2475_580010 [Paraburkholderia ribeironis]